MAHYLGHLHRRYMPSFHQLQKCSPQLSPTLDLNTDPIIYWQIRPPSSVSYGIQRQPMPYEQVPWGFYPMPSPPIAQEAGVMGVRMT